MKPDGYVAEVECYLKGPLDRHTYYFTSHVSQPWGVCWGAKFGCDNLGKYLGNAGISLWRSPGSARYWFNRYRRTHEGGWRLRGIIPVRSTPDGFVVCKEGK